MCVTPVKSVVRRLFELTGITSLVHIRDSYNGASTNGSTTVVEYAATDYHAGEVFRLTRLFEDPAIPKKTPRFNGRLLVSKQHLECPLIKIRRAESRPR